MEVDDKAWRLLSALQTDGRASLKELAAAVGLSVPATLERLRRLQEANAVELRLARMDDRPDFAQSAELEQRLAEGRWGQGDPTGFLAFYTGVFLRWSAAVAPEGLGPASEALRRRLANEPAMARVLAREGVSLDSLKRATD